MNEWLGTENSFRCQKVSQIGRALVGLCGSDGLDGISEIFCWRKYAGNSLIFLPRAFVCAVMTRPSVFTAALAVASPIISSRDIFSSDPTADCGIQPFGYGPPSISDETFTYNPLLQLTSLTAATPSGYTASFRNATGSNQQAGYQGYYLLQTYNPATCANLCNSVAGCTAFNIYYERDPLLNPADACPNPIATTYIKCALYSQPISAATATNNGQYREQFHVVIAGSDGFNHN